MRTASAIKKTKTTMYMSAEDQRLLDKVFIKRLRARNKTDRSALLCEGVRMLYEKEIGSLEEK